MVYGTSIQHGFDPFTYQDNMIEARSDLASFKIMNDQGARYLREFTFSTGSSGPKSYLVDSILTDNLDVCRDLLP